MALNGAGRSIFFTESSRNIGGQELQLLQQAQVLQGRGWQPRVLCPPGSRIAAEATRRGLPTELLALRNALDVASASRLLRLVRSHRPVAVVCHSGHDADLCGLAIRSAARLGLLRPRPVLVRMRTYQPGRARAFPYNRLFDVTFTPSEALRAQVLENPAIDPRRIRVLSPGIDFAGLEAGADAPLPAPLLRFLEGGGPVVAHPAMLRAEKGHAFLLEVVAALRATFPALRYVAAGEGPLLDDLRSRAVALGLQDCVMFAGMLPSVAPLLRRSDVLVMPSRYEPLGMSQIEALALGVPVVVSRVGGLPETVEDGVTGTLCPPPGSPGALQAWTAALAAVLTDPARAREQARRGRERVLRAFDPERNVATLLQA